MMPMKGQVDPTEIKKKVLGDLQDNMAQRRLVNISVNLDTGAVDTDAPAEGGEPEGDEGALDTGGEMGEPEDVLGRLKRIAK